MTHKALAEELATILRVSIREAPIELPQEFQNVAISENMDGSYSVNYGDDTRFIVKSDGKVFATNRTVGPDLGEVPVLLPLSKTGLGLAVLYLADAGALQRQQKAPKQSLKDVLQDFRELGFDLGGKNGGGMLS